MSELYVMIIEDDEVAAEILQKYVQMLRPNTRVEWSWNGFEALVQVQQETPDIIFLDYMMPKIDGMEFLKGLSELESGEGATIVIISAYVDKERENEFYNLGADYVLHKPVKPEQVEKLLRKILTD